MKKDALRKQEDNFVIHLYNEQHNINEIIYIIPLIIALFFSIIGAPIIIVLCELPVLWSVLLIVGPAAIMFLLYLLRKRIGIARFLKIKDVSDLVELTEIEPDVFETAANGNELMFGYSEYMKLILYNWFYGLNVLKNGKMKIYKVTYADINNVYLAVPEDNFILSGKPGEDYEKATFASIHLSDMRNGKTVNQLYCARVSKYQSAGFTK